MPIEDFFQNETQAAFQRYTNFEKLLPNRTVLKTGELKLGSSHSGEEGRFIENILRDLLNKYLPKNIRALSGFIVRPKAIVGRKNNIRLITQEENEFSTQIDILIYDVNNYPIYEKFEELVIVPPEGVIGIIQIKKTFYLNQLQDEIDKLIYNATLCNHYMELKHEVKHSRPPQIKVVAPMTSLVSFTAEWENLRELNNDKIKKVLEILKMYYTRKNYDVLLNVFTIIDRFSLIKASKEKFYAPIIKLLHYSNEAQYDNNGKPLPLEPHIFNPTFHVGIQQLLWQILKIYYHRTRNPHIIMPGFTFLGEKDFVKDELDFIPVIGSRISKKSYLLSSKIKEIKLRNRR